MSKTSEEETIDTLYEEAVLIVTETNKASISGLQRALKIGYNRAARIIEQMEDAGIVSQPDVKGVREVFAPTNVNDAEDVDIVEIAQVTMLGNLIQCCIDEIKAAPDVWQKLPEQRQREVIERVKNQMRRAARQVVHIIASDNRPTLHAHVEKVEFKDGVKATLTMGIGNPARHDLADAQGDQVLLVIMNSESYDGGEDDVQPDPDQSALPGIDEEAA